MAKKQTEYSVAIRIAGMVDPSYTRAMKNAMNYAKQFQNLDTKGKAKEIGIIAAGKGIQLAGKAIQTGARMAVQGVQALFGYMKDSVPVAAEYTSALRQVAKFTDGFRDSQNRLTADAYKFSDQVLGMKSVYNPTELLTISAQNAKAQIKKGDLFESLNLAQEVGAAFDSDANTAGGIIRELYSNQGKSLEEIRLLADAVNRVENESNADALALMQIISSKGALGEIGGVDQRLLAAAGAALGATNNGISGDSAKIATSLENFVLYLNGAAGKGSKARGEALGMLGLTPDATAKAMQADSRAFTETLLDGIMNLSGDKRLSVINNVFGKAATGDMAKLALNSEKFLHYLELAYDTGGATVKNEYDYAMEDPMAKYQQFQNQLTGLQIRMGNALLPGLTNFMDSAFGPMGELMKEMEGPIGEMGTAFGETIGILAKDPEVKKAFVDLAKTAPELITTLLPAIPPLARFAANLVTAAAPLTVDIMNGLVNSLIALEPAATLLAKVLGGLLGPFGKLMRSGTTDGTPNNPVTNMMRNGPEGMGKVQRFFTGVGSAFISSADKNINWAGGNATGAIYTKPATIWGTQIAEREAEGVFPLSYLDEMLSGRGGGENYQFTYSPTYNVGPGTDMRELRKTDEQQQREFERRMDRWAAKQKRLRFA